MIKENFYWILLGIAAGILIYLADKYIFLSNILIKKNGFPKLKPHRYKNLIFLLGVYLDRLLIKIP